MATSRRSFLKSSLAASASFSALGGLTAYSQTLHIPLGLQLYSLRELLPKDFEGTLELIASAGYREVEAAGFYDHTTKEVKHALDAAGLKCVSSHYGYGQLAQKFDEILKFNEALGVQYIVCASQAHRNAVSEANQEIYTLDDWRFLADQLNSFGQKVRAAGMSFAYHNHSKEFAKTEGVIPYVELMQRTDPAHVDMEMDCGWVVVTGSDPVEYLRRFSSRITMLHVKDFARPSTPVIDPEHYTITELGRGYIDYHPIFRQAAKGGRIKHIFVEQEGFDIPVKESLAEDARYMRQFLR